MITLTLITMASGLTLAPVSAAPVATPSHAMFAEQRLNRLTATAEARLRARAIERALAEGLGRLDVSLSEKVEAPAPQRIAFAHFTPKKP